MFCVLYRIMLSDSENIKFYKVDFLLIFRISDLINIQKKNKNEITIYFEIGLFSVLIPAISCLGSPSPESPPPPTPESPGILNSPKITKNTKILKRHQIHPLPTICESPRTRSLEFTLGRF